MNPLILISKPALIIYAVIACFFLYRGWSGHISDQATTACHTEQKQASSDFQAGARKAGDTAVQGAIDANNSDKPAVSAASDGLRNIPTAPPRCVSYRSGTGGTPSADSEAEVRRAREAAAEAKQRLDDAADDLSTCAVQLNLFEAAQAERASLVTVSQQPTGE